MLGIALVGCENKITNFVSSRSADHGPSAAVESEKEYNDEISGILLKLAEAKNSKDQDKLVEELTVLEQSTPPFRGVTSPFFLPVDKDGRPVQWEYQHNVDAIHSFIVSDISTGLPTFEAFRFEVKSAKVVEMLRNRRFNLGTDDKQ